MSGGGGFCETPKFLRLSANDDVRGLPDAEQRAPSELLRALNLALIRRRNAFRKAPYLRGLHFNEGQVKTCVSLTQSACPVRA